MNNAYARTTDPRTSHAAAAALSVSPVEARLLASLREVGPATSFELADRTGMPITTVSPRLKPLVKQGLARDSGELRRGEGGRSRIVWEAT